MTLNIFNGSLLLGWLLIVVGIAIVSVPAALVTGGALLMAVTLLLARWGGVMTGIRSRRATNVPK